MDDISPYDLGWGAGYSDVEPSCPFEEGSPEHLEWWEGYKQGERDC